MDDFAEEFARPFKVCFDLLERSHINILKTSRSWLTNLYNVVLILCAGIYYMGLFTYAVKAFSGELEFFKLAVIVPVLMVATQGTHKYTGEQMKIIESNNFEQNFLLILLFHQASVLKYTHVGILKAAIIISRKSKIKAIIMQLGATWRMDNITEEQIVMKNKMLKQLNNFHLVFYWMNILGSWQYMLVPLFETLFRRFILQQESELLLPFFCSLPFDQTSTWTRYISVYTFTTYSMFHLIYIYLGAEFLMITLCALLSIEFSLLQVDLRHVKPSSQCDVTYNNDVTEHNSKEARNIIQGHQRLIVLTTRLNEIFNEMIFLNLLFATITICFFGFVATKARGPTDMVNNFVGVVASMVPIFNLCYYGELLTGASAGIADAAYESLWYEGSDTHRKMLIFIIVRSQRPCCLTSLKYVPVSLNTFTTVMSTTWSYFSLATSMYDENQL